MTTINDELLTSATVHRAELVTYARRELGPWADAAEDMVQDAYLHLVGRAEAGEAPHSPRAWLHAVVRSRCAEERRRRSRERPGDLTETPAPAPGPHELAAGTAEIRWALAQVAELPANERDAIVAQVAGASTADAGSGRRSANAVYQSLHRARARLRQAREAAWAGLFPFPIRLWMARATFGAPLEAVPGGGRMAGAAVLACISVAGVVGGVQVARVAYSAPDPTPVTRPTSGSVASAPSGARIGVAAVAPSAALSSRRRGPGGKPTIARGIAVPVTVAPGGPPARTAPDPGPTTRPAPAKPVSGAPDSGSGTQTEAAFADSPAAASSDSATDSGTSGTPTDQPAEASPSLAPADQPAPADTGTTTEATDPLAP